MVGHVVTSNVGSGQGGPFLMSVGPIGRRCHSQPGFQVPVLHHRPVPTRPIGPASTIPRSGMRCSMASTMPARAECCPSTSSCINHIGRGSTLNQSPATKKGIEAHRKVEFVVASGYHMSTNCQYADIVFPVCTAVGGGGHHAHQLPRRTARRLLCGGADHRTACSSAKTDAELDEQLGTPHGHRPRRSSPRYRLLSRASTRSQGAAHGGRGRRDQDSAVHHRGGRHPGGRAKASRRKAASLYKQFLRRRLRARAALAKATATATPR